MFKTIKIENRGENMKILKIKDWKRIFKNSKKEKEMLDDIEILKKKAVIESMLKNLRDIEIMMKKMKEREEAINEINRLKEKFEGLEKDE